MGMFHHHGKGDGHFDRGSLRGMQVLKRLKDITDRRTREQLERGLDLGLEAAPSVEDRTIPTFARGELPHFAGINTFLKAPYARTSATSASTMRPSSASRSTAAPPTGRAPASGRRASAASRPSTHLQLRARRRSARADDAVRRRRRVHDPGQPRKELRPDHHGACRTSSSGRAADDAGRRPFDRLSLRARHRAARRRKVGIVHFDRHIDMQEKDLDERMHTTPWYWATELPNVLAEEPRPDRHRRLAGPRPGVKEARERGSNVLTIDDIEQLGVEKAAEIALELAWEGADAVYVASTSTRRLRLRARHRLARARRLPAARGAEAAGPGRQGGHLRAGGGRGRPPYDTSDITALLGVRAIMDVLGTLVEEGHLGSRPQPPGARAARARAA